MRYALIEDELVISVIMLDFGADWTPPEGTIIIPSETAGIGDTYANGVFTPPTVIIPPEQKHKELQQSAFAALGKSDITISRCYECGVAVPNDWVEYRDKLRAIVNGSDTTSTHLPIRPPWPQGT